MTLEGRRQILICCKYCGGVWNPDRIRDGYCPFCHRDNSHEPDEVLVEVNR